MNSSFLYHTWGLYSLECTREEYKGNTIILHVQSKKPQKTCPKCGKCNLVKNGYRTRDFLGLPIGGKKIIIRMKVQRYKCKCDGCDYDQQENFFMSIIRIIRCLLNHDLFAVNDIQSVLRLSYAATVEVENLVHGE